MTTTNPTPVTGTMPTLAELANAAQGLTAHPFLMGYPYTLGTLDAVLDLIADQHSGCAITHCRTCLCLRLGRAALIAQANHINTALAAAGQA